MSDRAIVEQQETDIQFLARGLRRALSGQGSAYSAEEFERLQTLIEHGVPEPDHQCDTHARPA